MFVDTIYRIEITTRSRELLLEEEPERFEMQAFDEEGEEREGGEGGKKEGRRSLAAGNCFWRRSRRWGRGEGGGTEEIIRYVNPYLTLADQARCCT